jgi:hypothetical protein
MAVAVSATLADGVGSLVPGFRDGYPARPADRRSVHSAQRSAYAVACVLPGSGAGGGGFDYDPIQPAWSAELAPIATVARMRKGGN